MAPFGGVKAPATASSSASKASRPSRFRRSSAAESPALNSPNHRPLRVRRGGRCTSPRGIRGCPPICPRGRGRTASSPPNGAAGSLSTPRLTATIPASMRRATRSASPPRRTRRRSGRHRVVGHPDRLVDVVEATTAVTGPKISVWLIVYRARRRSAASAGRRPRRPCPRSAPRRRASPSRPRRRGVHQGRDLVALLDGDERAEVVVPIQPGAGRHRCEPAPSRVTNSSCSEPCT